MVVRSGPVRCVDQEKGVLRPACLSFGRNERIVANFRNIFACAMKVNCTEVCGMNLETAN